MMYTQQQDHLKVSSVDELYKKFEALNPVRMALVEHDKDTDNGAPVAPHIHVMLSFSNARSLNSVAKSVNDTPNYIEKWNGEANNGFAYLVHATEKARREHKFRYDESCVRANFDYPALMRSIEEKVINTKKSNNTKLLLNSFKEGLIDKSELEERLTGSEYGRLRHQIENIYTKRLQDEAEKWREEAIEQGKSVCTIWIYGTAGTGKSSLAKEIARKRGQSCYVSGSSRDLFQSYMGEHTIILDDVRAGSISYEDFLRITDPYGIESGIYAPSRYHDKPLACDLIIITSPMSPFLYYCNSVSTYIREYDGFDQMQRRINLTIFMDMDYIYLAKYDNFYEYTADKTTKRDNKYSEKNRVLSTVRDEDLFNTIFD